MARKSRYQRTKRDGVHLVVDTTKPYDHPQRVILRDTRACAAEGFLKQVREWERRELGHAKPGAYRKR